jgi:hypothetical protein
MKESWMVLQDCLDGLRLIKKFTAFEIYYFEKQLTEIEKAYPYTVFCSPGLIVEYFECSICGLDIASVECTHLKGNLYSGKMCYAIAAGECEVTELSFTFNPRDKRCIIEIKGNQPIDFTQMLSKELKQKRVSIVDFDAVKLTSKSDVNGQCINHAHLAFIPRPLSHIKI